MRLCLFHAAVVVIAAVERFVWSVVAHALVSVSMCPFQSLAVRMNSVKKVQAALAAMPTKIAEHKKAMKASKPLKGLDKWLNESDPY